MFSLDAVISFCVSLPPSTWSHHGQAEHTMTHHPREMEGVNVRWMKDSLFCCEVVFIIFTDRGSDGLWEGCPALDSPGPFQRRGLQAVYSPFTVVYPGPWSGRKKGLPALEGITPAPGREETSLIPEESCSQSGTQSGCQAGPSFQLPHIPPTHAPKLLRSPTPAAPGEPSVPIQGPHFTPPFKTHAKYTSSQKPFCCCHPTSHQPELSLPLTIATLLAL